MTIALESESPNALAAPVADPNVYWPAGERRDGTVYFGLHLMQLVFKQSGGWGIPAIIGHEYSHILQYKRGFPNVDLKWRELHADFMSGFFTEHRARYKKQDIKASAMQLFDGGDWAFNSPTHHGTPNERYAAFRAGVEFNLKLNKPDAGKAYDQGLEYLKGQGAQL